MKTVAVMKQSAFHGCDLFLRGFEDFDAACAWFNSTYNISYEDYLDMYQLADDCWNGATLNDDEDAELNEYWELFWLDKEQYEEMEYPTYMVIIRNIELDDGWIMIEGQGSLNF